MLKNSLKPEAGKLLLSEPFSKDFYFKRSVVLLADHSEEGSFGIILNKPVNLKLSDITSEFPDFDPQVYIGGPVKTDSLFVIHSLGDKISNSVKIAEGIYWGGDMDLIKVMIANNQISEDDIRFYIGYSGWSSNQLKEELDEQSWLVTDFNFKELITSKPDKLWIKILNKMDNEYTRWVNYPLDPSYN